MISGNHRYAKRRALPEEIEFFDFDKEALGFD